MPFSLLTRRDLLRAGGVGVAATVLPGLCGATPTRPVKVRSVLLLIAQAVDGWASRPGQTPVPAAIAQPVDTGQPQRPSTPTTPLFNTRGSAYGPRP